MKLAPLVEQFSRFLPKYTNLFSDEVSVTDVSITTSTVTVTTGTAYNFGNTNVFMSELFEGIPIIAFIYDDTTGVIEAQTATDHGLVSSFNLRTKEKTPVTVTLTDNTDTSLNGNFPLLAVPNRFTFAFQFTPGLGSVTVDGNIINYAFNRLGGLQVVTFLTPTTFSYDAGEDLTGVIPTSSGTMSARGNIRISVAATPQRAFESYTINTQGSNAVLPNDEKFWLFLTYGASNASKNRTMLNDATNYGGGSTDPRQLLVETFDANVLASTANDLSGALTMEKMEDVKQALFKTVLNIPLTLPYTENEQYAYVYNGSELRDYDTSVLQYLFEFEGLIDITFQDMFTDFQLVPFRNIDGELTNSLGFSVDLDEEPL